MPYLVKFFNWIEERIKRKAGLIEKYELMGLMLFVAIPFPTAGAWTGSFPASILKIRFRPDFFAISLGIVIAAFVISLITWCGAAIFKA